MPGESSVPSDTSTLDPDPGRLDGRRKNKGRYMFRLDDTYADSAVDKIRSRTDRRREKSRRLEAVLTEPVPGATTSASQDNHQCRSGLCSDQAPEQAYAMPAPSSHMDSSPGSLATQYATSGMDHTATSHIPNWKQTARDDLSYLHEFIHQRCLSFSQVGPLVFEQEPDMATPYQLPEKRDPILANNGPHALAVRVKANTLFLEQEDILVSLARDIMASPPYGDDTLDEEREELLRYLHRELDVLELVKKEQWERQCRARNVPINEIRLDLEPPFVDTGIFSAPSEFTKA